jgi:hypothetical protein
VHPFESSQGASGKTDWKTVDLGFGVPERAAQAWSACRSGDPQRCLAALLQSRVWMCVLGGVGMWRKGEEVEENEGSGRTVEVESRWRWKDDEGCCSLVHISY